MNTFIFASGQSFDIGCRVIKWDDPAGFSFYPNKKYNARNIDLTELQKQINCFVLHHSVTYTAKNTYLGLIGRGLSVNFIIDDNDENGYATIYQCLDIKDAGWSHGPLNNQGPGVEISYQPAAWQDPNLYSEDNKNKWHVQDHQVTSDTIHNRQMKVFGPTKAQVNSCCALLWGFCELFPDVTRSFPKDDGNQFIKTVVTDPSGLLNHFNITNQKIDPAGFPHQEVEDEINARFQFGF